MNSFKNQKSQNESYHDILREQQRRKQQQQQNSRNGYHDQYSHQQQKPRRRAIPRPTGLSGKIVDNNCCQLEWSKISYSLATLHVCYFIIRLNFNVM